MPNIQGAWRRMRSALYARLAKLGCQVEVIDAYAVHFCTISDPFSGPSASVGSEMSAWRGR